MVDENNGGEKKSELVRLGGLWQNESDNGKYLAGNFCQARILVFKNKYKEGDNDPDYVMYLAPGKKKEEDTGDDDGGL